MRLKLAGIVLAATAMTSMAQADIFTPSIQKQIELGQEAAKEVRKKEKILPDSDPRVQELRRIGNKLVAQLSEKERKDKPFQYTFDVIDSKELNAFAFPGGPIFFYTGLLDKMKYEDDVAGILGHEMTHIRNEHWARQYAGSIRRNLGLIAILTLLRANDDWFNLANMAESLSQLQYSRGDELDADNKGYELMVSASYNPKGMVNVFEILQEASKSKPPEFISTHPDTQNRINKLNAKITSTRERFPKLTPRKSVNSKVAWSSSGWPTLISKGGKSYESPLLIGS